MTKVSSLASKLLYLSCYGLTAFLAKKRRGFDGGLAPVHNTFITLPWLVLLFVSEWKW